MSRREGDATAELAWERRARHLLQSIALAAAESPGWRDAMERAVREICRATDWPVGHVLVRDESGELVSAKVWHLDDEPRFQRLREVSETIRFASGVGLPGRVLASGQPLWLRDIAAELNFPRARLVGDLGVHAAFGLPVLVRGEVFAVLEFFSPEPVEPLPVLLEVMTTIGSQLGRVVERARADEALRQSELRFRSVAQSAKDAIVSANVAGQIVFWNLGAARMFGYQEDEVLGQPLTMVIPERYRAAHLAGMARVEAGGEPHVIGRTVELAGVRRDGSEFALELSLASWKIGEQSYYTGILRDISERKEAEERLRQVAARLRASEQAAIEASRAKSIFLANMSHELRTPLNAILGFVQLLLRDRALGGGQRESLEVILRSGEHLLALINDILTLSKVEAGESVLHPTAFDPRRMIAGLRELFHLRAQSRGIGLRVVADDFPPRVTGDEGKLRQVLINLVGNAVKFTERGEIALAAAWHEGRARFLVEDTGCGIAADDLARIFAPFVQSAAGERAQEGSGLGLTISRDFVRLMGGELEVDSVVGQGTCFSFQIPLPAAGEAAPEPPPARRVVGLSPDHPPVRVLVVDNADDNRRLLARLHEAVGFQVRDAADGQAAVAVWQEWRPQVVWMDLRMPVMDGYQATRAIRAAEGAGPRTVIIAITASAFEHDRGAVLAAGCDAITFKPFQENTIFDLLERLAGVRFVREEAQEPPPAPTLSPARLAALPGDWRAELARALEDGDDLGTQRTVARIAAVDAPLADELARMLKAFQLDELLGLLERVES